MIFIRHSICDMTLVIIVALGGLLLLLQEFQKNAGNFKI
jgi:hypothetical protein